MIMPLILRIYICILAALSVFAFCLYALDKRKAIKGKWRIPEATLLGISFLGGGFGGYLAMLIARHKTKHFYFHIVNLLGIAWQVGLLAYLIFISY